MSILKLIIIAITTFVVVCKSSYITSNVKKCELTDGECLANLYTSILKEAATNGIPEMGIPIVDPYKIEKIEVLPFGLVNITLFDGIAKGIGTCRVTSVSVDLNIGRKIAEVFCDTLSVGGSYKILPSPALKSLIGNVNIHGNGKGGFTAEKIKLLIDFALEVKRLEDGKTHFVINNEETTYTFKVLGHINVEADNLYVGSQEISGVAVKLLSENTGFTVRMFGTVVADKIVEIVLENFEKLYTNIPVSEIIKTDLSKYVKN